MLVCAGLLRRELSGLALGGRCKWPCDEIFYVSKILIQRPEDTDAQSRHLTSSTTPGAPWRVAAPSPPSIHTHPHDKADDAPAASTLPEQLRAVMRLIPHSVVVCTSVFSPPTISPSEAVTSTTEPLPVSEPRGMTMSSFTSLALRPTPIVTFNVATPSRTLDAVSSSRAFNVHVLSGDAEGACVAEWFRRGNAAGLGVFDAVRMREGCGCEVVGAQGGKGRQRAPLLRGKGVLYALRCNVLDDGPTRGLVQVRDHVVVLAEVVEIVEGEGSAAAGEETFGLAYADRRYRQLGGTMVNEEG